MITYKTDSKESIESSESSMPVLAMCYDFDKTLTPDDMQAQGFIQSVGYNEEQIKQFWQESNELAKKNDMDNNLAYMYKMIQEAVGHFYITKEKLMEYGNQVELYEGVRTWFERIRDYGLEHGVRIEHYIISSGLKEMIEGTEMAKEGAFTKIYASAFLFDDKGVAVWPAQAINYTNKTQFLFRIQDPIKKDKDKVYKMMRHHRIRYYAPADYSNGSKLDTLVKQIIRKTAAYEVLEGEYIHCKYEAEE